MSDTRKRYGGLSRNVAFGPRLKRSGRDLAPVIYVLNEQTVRQRIIAARIEEGYSLTQAATLLNCDRSSLSRKESGERRIYAEDLIGFVKAYKKPIQYFFT